jgi:hypothetical protein
MVEWVRCWNDCEASSRFVSHDTACHVHVVVTHVGSRWWAEVNWSIDGKSTGGTVGSDARQVDLKLVTGLVSGEALRRRRC